MKTNSTALEELVNALTCGFGALIGLVGGYFLLRHAWNSHDMIRNLGYILYLVMFIVTYIVATLYHIFFFTRAKPVFRLLDHGVIYLFIAASYTVFALGVFRRDHALWLIGVVWVLAVAGIISQFYKMKHTRFTIFSYLAYAAISFVGVRALLEHMPLYGNILLATGGGLILFGLIFYLWKKLYMNHAIWHAFVLLGTFCHFGALFFMK